MATQAVSDPGSLKTWEDAFQYPLPTVRNLSTKLRRNIDEHRSRLRSLVGASYRDLLGTAERIIEMDRQIQGVEHGLSDISRLCNSSILERVDTNHAALERSWSQKDGQDKKLQSLAQSKILTSALSVVSGLIRTGGEALQAAKLMFLTRLLYKSLSESEHTSIMLDRHRRTITALRTKLLAYIDRTLGQDAASSDHLSATLAAYALITSSSPKDVLKHFLAVRIASLESLIVTAGPEDILKALSLYSATFQTVQTVFPKRLAEILIGLSKVTLLSDAHIKSVEELNLNIYGRWIPDDVQSFTPWIQRDNLTAQEGKDAMAEFSSSAREILLTGTAHCLQATTSIVRVLDIRKRVLSATLSLGTSVKFNDFMPQLDELRILFASRLEHLITEEATIKDFSIIVNQESPATSSIWSLAQNELDLTAGGSKLRSAILRQRHGRDAHLDTVLAPFEAWRTRAEQCWNNIKVVRSTKWDEYVEQDPDDGDDEDTVIYHNLLSTTDADRLQPELWKAAKTAVEQTFEKVHRAASNQTMQPQFLIRALRELQAQYLATSKVIELSEGSALVCHDTARSLHTQLAASISSVGIESLSKAYSNRHFLPLDLWEGIPKLPLQPLPATFEFVLTIQQEMVRIGEDVWSHAAVEVLRQAIAAKLRDIMSIEIVIGPSAVEPEPLENDVTPDESANTSAAEVEPTIASITDTTNVTVQEQPMVTQTASDAHATSAAADLSQDYIQRLFDAIYISRVFETAEKSALFQPHIDVLQERAKLEVRDAQRLHKHVGEYWKKTYLLFGLLAHPGSSYSK